MINECTVCGTPFEARRSVDVYCTKKCRDEKANKTRREKAAKGEDKSFRESVIDGLSLCCTSPLENTSGLVTTLRTIEWSTEKFRTDKRHDRTKEIIERAKEHIESEGTMSLRHLHYLLVSDGLIENTKEQYGRLSNWITEARERGDIGYHEIEDNGRDSTTYSGWDSPQGFITSMASAYRGCLWETQPNHVEVWTEKNSVVSVVEGISQEFRVPLRPLKGQGSTSFIWEIAKEYEGLTKPLHIIYLGDHDPCGYVIERSARERLIEHLLDRFGWTITDVVERLRWTRVGFLKSDFEEFQVTALDAKDGDTNRPRFEAEHGPECAELEGLPPHELRRRVRAAVEEKMDLTAWTTAKEIEDNERERLVEVVAQADWGTE